MAVQGQAAAQSPAVPKRSESRAPVPKSSGDMADALAGAVPRPVSGTLVPDATCATHPLVPQLPSAALAATVDGSRLAPRDPTGGAANTPSPAR